MEYREQLSFFDNLRSMKIFLFFIGICWTISAVMFLIYKISSKARESWKFKYVLVRIWNFMGFNAIIRVLNISFLMVLFSGYVTIDKKIKMVDYGHHFEVKVDNEVMALAFCLFIPIIL